MMTAENASKKFIKKNKGILIVATILIILVGLYFLVGYIVKRNNTTITEKSATIKLLEFNQTDVAQVEIQSKGDRFIYKRIGSSLVPYYPKNARLIIYEGEAIASELMKLKAQKIIAENPKNLAQYGLKNPETIKVTMNDGEIYEVEVGKGLPFSDSIYLKLKGSNTVYSVSGDTGSVLTLDKETIWDPYLYKLDNGDITGFTVKKGNKLVFSAQKTGDSNWDIVAPVTASANIDKINSFLDSIKAPSAIALVESNAKNLSKYGLDNPSCSFQVKTAQGKEELLFGDEKARNSIIYAKLANGNDIFTINESSISLIDAPLSEVINHFVYYPFITDVSKIVVKMDGTAATSKLNVISMTDTSKNEYEVNGKNAVTKGPDGKTYFAKYYDALVSISIDGIDAAAKPSLKPEASIEYYPKKATDKETKLEFVSKNNKSYFIFKNGKYTGLVISKDKLNAVRNAYNEMMKVIK